MSFEFLNAGSSEGETKFSPIDTFIDPVSKIRVSNPGNLIDTDFEYGLQPTKWETVELINNTPAFFSKSGDTTIPDITSITTSANTREITVTTAFPHNLAVGIPIRVAGTKSTTADGSYIINAIPTPTTFTYLCRSPQETTISIYDLYTSIITGEFFQGSQISIAEAEGITTDAAGPASLLTVKTKNKHGFGPKTPFYFLNLNSTVAQEFEAQNSASVSFDPTNSATAQTFDGSNTLLVTPIDFSNSATTSTLENINTITSRDATARTVTVSTPEDNWELVKEGDPVYYSLVNASDPYLQANPKGIVFVKNLVASPTQATFQITQFPNGTALETNATLAGYFQIADLARTFAGNNSDINTEIITDLVKTDDIVFDGGNQGYAGNPEDVINGVSTLSGVLGTTITVTSSDSNGILDYYPGAMLLFTTTGTPPDGLVDNTTYFVESFNDVDGSTNQYQISVVEYPGDSPITPNATPAVGTHTFTKIGVSIDKDIWHFRASNYSVGDMLEFDHPVDGEVQTDSSKSYFFVKEAFDEHNYSLTEKSYFAPPGQVEYTTPGTYTWTAPIGVYDVSVVAVGGGGGGSQDDQGDGGNGGGGGGLGWKNNIPVVAGQTYTVVVGAGGSRDTDGGAGSNATGGGNSYFIDTSTVAGLGGGGATGNGGTAGGFVGDGGGNGGVGGTGSSADAGGGGGAGGYSGNGGDGGNSNLNGSAGSGGGGGGGGAGGDSDASGAGGGVGIYGQGANGTAGVYNGVNGTAGGGGSGGQAGSANTGSSATPSTGGNFGGGGGSAENTGNENGPGAGGAVRIIWGEGRAFPSTRTADE